MTKFLSENIRSIAYGKTVILGIGNRLRGDDGAGCLVVDKVKDFVAIPCIDAGVAPENYLEKIVALGVSSLIIVDAINFNGIPGEIRLFSSKEMATTALSTHAFSLRMIGEYLKARLPMSISLIGIQPSDIALNSPVSKSVVSGVEELSQMFRKVFASA